MIDRKQAVIIVLGQAPGKVESMKNYTVFFYEWPEGGEAVPVTEYAIEADTPETAIIKVKEFTGPIDEGHALACLLDSGETLCYTDKGYWTVS